MMSLLTELEIIWRKNFYKYVVPTALLPPETFFNRLLHQSAS
jgi:hypothetical protein